MFFKTSINKISSKFEQLSMITWVYISLAVSNLFLNNVNF